MIKISETFKKGSYDYQLEQRDGAIALFSMSSNNEKVAYEVHKVRIKTGSVGKIKSLGGNVRVLQQPTREILAGNEDFGSYGWSFQHLDNALVKYNELVSKK